MNRKVGDKFERSWTNYHLFSKRGTTAADDFRFRMAVVRSGKAPACPEGFKFVAVFSGYSKDEAWDEFCKVHNLRDQVRPADPPSVPQSSLF